MTRLVLVATQMLQQQRGFEGVCFALLRSQVKLYLQIMEVNFGSYYECMRLCNEQYWGGSIQDLRCAESILPPFVAKNCRITFRWDVGAAAVNSAMSQNHA